MDPIQFRIDWEVLAEVLTTIVVLAFLLERALSIVTENKWFVNSLLDEGGFKEILAFAVSLFAVKLVGFDALAVIFKLEQPGWPGFLVTAAVVAGGSKAAIKLFHDIWDWKSSVRRQKDKIRQGLRDAQLATAIAERKAPDKVI